MKRNLIDILFGAIDVDEADLQDVFSLLDEELEQNDVLISNVSESSDPNALRFTVVQDLTIIEDECSNLKMSKFNS
jgi:hypothetical protein